MRIKKQKQQLLTERNTLGSSLLAQESHLEFCSNRELLVDGCKGIVEYNYTLIRLHIPEGQLKVSGRELQIACMSEDSLIVRGFLSGLEYCN